MISYLVTFYIYIVNMIVGLGRRSSKEIALLVLIIAYILMVATNNNDGSNGDYRAYLQLYDHFKEGGNISNITGYTTDYGYMVLMYVISKLKVSYNIFIAILSLFSIKLIYSTLKRITKNFNFVLFLYIMFPFFYDIIQFRFFFAYSIVVFAFKYILFEEDKSYVKYIVLIIISSMFHKVTLFFLCYLIINFRIKNIIKVLIYSSGIVTVVNFILRINIIKIIAPIFKFKKFISYSSYEYKLNILTQFGVIILILYSIYIIYIIRKKNPTYVNNRILWLNCLNVILLPFLLGSLDFERFFRPIFIINYALIGQSKSLMIKEKKMKMIFILIILLFTRFFVMRGYAQMAFENNYVFDFIKNLFR